MDRLDRLEKAEFLLMSREWNRLSGVVLELINRLAMRPGLSPHQVRQLETYQEFQIQLALIQAQYANYNAALISRGQQEFGEIGIRSAQQVLDLSARFYLHIPESAVSRMVGLTMEGTPLHDILVRRYGENALRASQVLVDSVALGRSPIETARLLGPVLDGNVSDSLRIARTEQIAVFREMQTESYIASGIVTGMDLVAEPDACEICMAEVAQNPHGLDYIVDTHPNCRCGLAGVVI